MSDSHHLDRFIHAQTPVYDRVVAELAAGQKRTHWIWFIFPQVSGLAHSSMSQTFGIGSIEEARAYLSHSILGPRLVACTELVRSHAGRSLATIFGSPDDVKFYSSMTLFAAASVSSSNTFAETLRRYWNGLPDERTLKILDRVSPDRP